MEKLKTLKEMGSDCADEYYPEKVVGTEELKEEAINWLKESPYGRQIAAVCFIKHFFNITKEDLS